MKPGDRALVELRRDNSRREWTFGEVDRAANRFAAHLTKLGVARGDVVMTLIGNRPEWVIALVACFRLGAVALPCNEQLRAGDLRARLAVAKPRVVVCDERNLSELVGAGWSGETVVAPDKDAFEPGPGGDTGPLASITELRATDPALITFTSGTTGSAKGIVHGRRYVSGQALQAEHWLDARFDHNQRLEVLEREAVNVLCMAPTEYRVIAKRATLRRYPALRGLVAAGEALNPEVLRAWKEATGLEIRDGYGQTETGQLTGMPLDEGARPGSMGKPLPGIDLMLEGGELVLRTPLSDPTFFVAYLGGEPAPVDQPWRTGDRVREDEDGYLYFEGRGDDVIISSGYRIGPFEVESALVSHRAVAEAAAVAAPDEERGSVVRAVVVLREGVAPSDALARELQEWVKGQTAPYKYPRIVEFADELPKTATGKVRRALLRDG